MNMHDFFNVFEDHYESIDHPLFEGSGAQGQILYEADDRRHFVIAGRYPNGLKFTSAGSSDFREAFYIVSGQGSRTFPDGEVRRMAAGDLVLVTPEVEVAYVYDPGVVNVSFFWSTDKPLPDLAPGIRKRSISLVS